MKFTCYKIENRTCIKGRHASYCLIIGILALYQFYFMYFPIWNLYLLLPILFVFLHYKTSWFTIQIDKQSIIITKQVFRINYFKHCFHFDSCQYDSSAGSFIFSQNEKSIKLIFEGFEIDEFGVEINNKYSTLGTMENSNLTFGALSNWLKQRKNPPLLN